MNHDICFRAGINAKGEETYTPRTLIYDLKGGFGGLRKWGGLYDQQMILDETEQPEAENIWYVAHCLHMRPKTVVLIKDLTEGMGMSTPSPLLQCPSMHTKQASNKTIHSLHC